jgi:hypothetical protein
LQTDPSEPALNLSRVANKFFFQSWKAYIP